MSCGAEPLIKEEMDQDRNSTHTVRTSSKRWWILVILLFIASGIFWALGRSDGGAERTDRTTSSPAPYLAEPDQIENTVEAEGDIPDPSAINPIHGEQPAPTQRHVN